MQPPTAQRERDACVASPNGFARPARHVDRPAQRHSVLHALQTRTRLWPPTALPTAMYCASCVRLPLRSAKCPPQLNIHLSTDSLRLPRFRKARLVNSHTRRRFFEQGQDIEEFHCCAQLQLPAPATQNNARPRSREHHSPRRPRETQATYDKSPRLSREGMRAAPRMTTFPHTCPATHGTQRPLVLVNAHVHGESHACHTTPCPTVPDAFPRETSKYTHSALQGPKATELANILPRRRNEPSTSTQPPSEDTARKTRTGVSWFIISLSRKIAGSFVVLSAESRRKIFFFFCLVLKKVFLCSFNS